MAGHAVEPDSLDFFFVFFFFFYFLLMLCLSCSRGPFCLTEAEARLWAIKVRCPGTHVKVGELSAKEVCKIHATHTTHAAEARAHAAEAATQVHVVHIIHTGVVAPALLLVRQDTVCFIALFKLFFVTAFVGVVFERLLTEGLFDLCFRSGLWHTQQFVIATKKKYALVPFVIATQCV